MDIYSAAAVHYQYWIDNAIVFKRLHYFSPATDKYLGAIRLKYSSHERNRKHLTHLFPVIFLAATDLAS